MTAFNGKISGSPAQGAPAESSGCCGKGSKAEAGQPRACQSPSAKERWVIGLADTPVGKVPRVATSLAFRDVLGSWKCRWSIGRMDYKADPGLYCVGTPDDKSPVLVTANYKMTFDRLRKELSGVTAWILVLDTDGVNVWCAAGKGTFGTDELIFRIGAAALDRVVSHRTLILPQLAATGVAAHEVAKRSGFKVVYGPVRAEDLKAFLGAGMTATKEMREVRFPLWDRLVLTPMELVTAVKPLFLTLGILFVLNVAGLGQYGGADFIALMGAILAGCVVTPALLPWLPGKAFSFKGALLGLVWAVIVNVGQGFPGTPEYGWLKAAAYLLLIPAISSFCAMNFTGSSTYTSLSGVDKEMRIALPAMLISAAAGVILMLAGDIARVFG